MLQGIQVRCPTQPCACLDNRWDQCFIRLLDGMLQVIGFAGACDGDFALRIPVRIRAISITEPAGSACSALPCSVQRVLGARCLLHTLPGTSFALFIVTQITLAKQPFAGCCRHDAAVARSIFCGQMKN